MLEVTRAELQGAGTSFCRHADKDRSSTDITARLVRHEVQRLGLWQFGLVCLRDLPSLWCMSFIHAVATFALLQHQQTLAARAGIQVERSL